MTESKANPIATYLAERYPCEALPFGALVEVGKVFGVTRERVRQIAKANGFASYRDQERETRVIPGRAGRTLCRDCGKPYGGKRFAENHVSRTRCPDCRWVMIDCAQCGKPKKVATYDYISHLSPATAQSRAEKGQPQYTGRVFCDHECQGRWMGINVGFRAHPENAGGGTLSPEARAKSAAVAGATKIARYRQKVLDAVPGTTEEIIERSGVGRSAASRHLNQLVADDVIYYVTLPGSGSPREYHRKESA